MAQLDQFMGVMLDEGDSELLVGTNAAPRLLRGGKERDLIPRKLTAAQVRHLLTEIVPPAVQTLLNGRGSAEFVYNLSGRESVQVTIRDWAGNTESSFRSARASARTAESSSRLVASAPLRDAAPSSERLGAASPERRPVAASPAPSPAPSPAAPVPERRPAPSQPSLEAAAVARPPERQSSSDEVSRVQLGADKNVIDVLFREMVGQGSSDLHMSTGECPMIRKDGDMKRLAGHGVLTQEFMESCLFPIMPPRNRKQYDDVKDADFAYEIEGLSRFRCNVFMDRKGIGAVFRTIPTKIITVEDLGLSRHLQNLCFLTKGLVLVTGPTGSGKSTTLSALVDFVNRERHDHIITIEDPIEFVHPNKNCLVNQREVGEHTSSFKAALRAALREDPDIVLVGEMRDLETIAIAIETAETGHLVFGTLHTSTAYSTVDRIIDQFPADRQAQIRVMLSESLKGVVSQTLCRKIGGGRIAALEVLLGTPAVANLIREGKTFQIPSIMQTSKKMGMLLLNDALLELVLAKKVEPKEAYTKAIDKGNFVTMAKAANVPLEFLGGVV